MQAQGLIPSPNNFSASLRFVLPQRIGDSIALVLHFYFHYLPHLYLTAHVVVGIVGTEC
jgi:hypothetical protein